MERSLKLAKESENLNSIYSEAENSIHEINNWMRSVEF